MSTTSVGQIGLDLVVNKKSFEKDISGINKLAKKAGAMLASAFAVKKLVDFGKQCIDLGSDLEEVQNVVDVTFPNMSAKIDEFAKSAATSFGLSETMAKQYTGTFGAMAKAFGFSESAAYDMSATLTGLAGDVASFYNLSQDEAYTKLKSVFTGETETLKDLGVVMTQTALDSYALANGFGKTTSAMSEAEKVSLRYAFVQDKLSAATGDFARTSGSWANQVKILTLQFESLKASIGQGLINLFTPVLQVINKVIAKVATLANAFKAFTELIAGKKSSEVGNAAANSLESATASAEGLEDATTSAGNAASKAAKKMRELMGFDSINKLSDNSESSSGTSGSSGSSAGTAVDFGSLSNGKTVIDELDESFTKVFENLKTSFAPLAAEFERFAGISKSAFEWLLDNVLKPLAEFTITEVVPRFFEMLANGLEITNNVLIALQPLWEWFWDNILLPIAEWTAGAFLSIWDSINAALGTFADWCGDNPEAIEAAAVAIGGFFAAWKVTETLSFIQQSGGLVAALTRIKDAVIAGTVAKIADKAETLILNAMYAKDFVVSLAKGTAGLISQAAAWALSTAAKIADTVAQTAMTAATILWNATCTVATAVTTAFGAAITFLTSPIGLVVVAITALVAAGVLLYKNWDSVKEFGLSAWEKIHQGITTATNKIKSVFTPIVNWFKGKYESIKSIFTSVGTWFGSKFTSAYNAVKKPFDSIGTFFSNVYKTVTSKFKSIGTAVGNAISGSFKSVMNSALKTVESTVNKAIGFINSAIGVINKVPGVNISKVKTVSLPRLAQGGYVKRNAPQLAIIGDNMRHGEIVAPEDKLAAMAKQAASMSGGASSAEVVSLLKQILVLLQGLNLVATVDGDGLRKLIVKLINENTKANGVCEIIM